MKKFEIWSEGYAATGEYGGAVCLGTQEGETFGEACEAWAAQSSDPQCFNRERLSFWGCSLFEMEVDARKSFG